MKALDAEFGSITGGGRYDNLTGIFGLPDISGVGISFGADRIYDVLTQLNLFPEGFSHSTDLLFVNFGEKEADWILPILKEVRSSGIRCELYPEEAKMRSRCPTRTTTDPFVARAVEKEMRSASSAKT